ncbi:MAG: UDP-N-acetylmuramoyl-L-alanine--D-glutamate ligase [Candidatus Paceibacterota bacterium]|jgi:UDP-N-acetylmuramoylalanine--D-glutamate ligase
MIKKFKNLKVTVMGLGIHGGGLGAVKYLLREGAKVTITDLKTSTQLKSVLQKIKNTKNVHFVLGQHRLDDFIGADLVLKNPAIDPNSRYLEIARKNKIPIETDIGIFFELCPCPIIGITGTKGKSTTTSLIYSILSQKSTKVFLGGNVRISVLDNLKKLTEKSISILELSSWQLEDLDSHKKSPHIALVLNLLPDHLNRHNNFQSYVDSKKIIFKYQNKNDILILNYDDPITRSFEKEAKGKVIYFGRDLNKINIPGYQKGAYFNDEQDSVYYGEKKEPILDISKIKLRGNHNLYNILAAITVAEILKIKDNDTIKAIQEFRGIEGRLEKIGDIGTLTFYNDTTATMPDAVIAAIESFSNKDKIVLIAGGQDKGLDYEGLSEIIVKKVGKLILLKGNASDKIIIGLKKVLGFKKKLEEIVKYSSIESMEEAVDRAVSCAEDWSVILLSPGAASFNLFENEFDRGNQFKKAVKRLEKNQ